ncbi:MAG: hypothetical protein ACWA5W_01315 [Phycisphaerales bacterium]
MPYEPPRSLITLSFLAVASASMLGGCSDSNDNAPPATPAFEADTSYLDDLAIDQPAAEPEVVVDDVVQDEPVEDVEQPKEYLDEDREWTPENKSKSIFGRARDKAKNLADQLQDSTTPANGVAITYADEEYAQAAGFAWDMPEDWQMAVPAAGRFAEMYIQNPLGNASVAFTKETQSPNQIKRALQSSITDIMTGRSKAKVSTKTVMGHAVTIFDLTGTYIDPGAKGTSNGSPFYAIHAAVVELPTTKVLIKLWGPEDTVNQNKGKFDAMIEKMYEK